MAIPDYQTVMLPLLKLTSDAKEHQIRAAVNTLADQFKLTEAERKETLPSGGGIFDNRVGWARTYLKKAGLLSYPKRMHFQITERGQAVLGKNPMKIDVQFLRQFPEFVEFQAPKREDDDRIPVDAHEESSETPEELLASGYLKLRKQLESDLLARVKDGSARHGRDRLRVHARARRRRPAHYRHADGQHRSLRRAPNGRMLKDLC
jgi:restriction system protein